MTPPVCKPYSGRKTGMEKTGRAGHATVQLRLTARSRRRCRGPLAGVFSWVVMTRVTPRFTLSNGHPSTFSVLPFQVFSTFPSFSHPLCFQPLSTFSTIYAWSQWAVPAARNTPNSRWTAMKKGASRRMRPAQIMPMEKTYSWPLKSGVRIRNWSLTSLPLLLGMKVS